MSKLPQPVRPHALVRALCMFWLVPKREYLKRFRIGRTVSEHVAGLDIVVLPEVFNPVAFRTGQFFAEYVSRLPAAESASRRALDLGTGSGILAMTAAKLGYSTDAVDLNDEAVRCATNNVVRNELQTSVRVFHGDLFAPLENHAYDLILFSPPSFRGKPRSRFELCWQAEDIFERFAAALPDRLSAGGQALVLQSSDGDEAGLLEAFAGTGLDIDIATRKHFGVEILSIYRLQQRQ